MISLLLSAESSGAVEQAVERRGTGGATDKGAAVKAAASSDGEEFPT